jgi:hypothetical protein
MSKSAPRDPASLIVARFIVSAVDSGGRITLRERAADLSIVAPPGITRALSRTLNSLMGGDEALDLILNRLVSIPEAARLSGYTEADILSLIERGELGGLCIDGLWFVSRRRAEELAGLASAKKWFQDHGY